MQRIRFTGAGGNEVVDLQTGPDPAVGDEQVLVGARYAGVNPLDVLQRDGHYPVPPGTSPDLPGVETAGTVMAVGDQVHRWAIGDRVMGLVPEGGLANRVVAHQDHVLAVPSATSDLAAATLPEAVMTAFDALVRARTQLRDVVGIRGINGGVGLATYQIAAAMGAVPLGIARSTRVIDELADLGINAVLESEFEAAVADGASVMVELVGGSYVAQDLHLLARGGRVVVVSVAAGNEALIPTHLLMSKRADLMGTVLRPRSTAEKTLLTAAVAQHVLPLVREHRLVMPVEEIFEAREAWKAFDHLAKPGKVGKVVLDFGVSARE